MKTATISDLFSWNPCNRWTEDLIREIVGDKDKWSALEILALKKVPIEDRFWVVLRAELISEKTLILFSALCAEHVLHLFEEMFPKNNRPRNAIQAAKDFVEGKVTKEVLYTAKAAAKAAARDTLSDAAWAAARDTALTAAWDAVWAAAMASTEDAERKWQLERLIGLIKEYET